MNILPCSEAQATKYADGVECEAYPSELSGLINLNYRLISSNFDPDLYHNTE